MRILFCKIHCPSFICFCKPSPHLYTAGPLKLENSPHAPVAVDTCNHHECGDTDGETIAASKDFTDVDGKQRQEQQVENFAKSSLKKTSPDSKEVQKKRVQWPDLLGKELVEIREFEPSETEDTDNEYENTRGCVCVIL
ncbi:uncharacterized protein LOC119997745 [Tripterygium wilfordii]|uniref:uncharacterized protein LOC119997745 n=1 Tax=Tripterygium wilfordii TaxID=458696 RepID=UPI0018F80CC0|nr:uncharacterized protein LOC119997745 [Tripterygium wilfordii]